MNWQAAYDNAQRKLLEAQRQRVALLAASEDFIGYCDNCGGTGTIGLGRPCSWCTPLRAAIASAKETP